jgi:hypothetical protein
MFIQPVVEDIVQEQILRVIFSKYCPELDLYPALGKRGNAYIKQKIKGFNAASLYTPYVILTDLDNISCPPQLLEEWIDFPSSKNFIFRIAVREAEAWLLADRIGFAKFIGVAASRIPLNTETILNPKEFVISLARRSSKRSVKVDIIPKGHSSVGPGYNPRMEEFILSHWNIENAIHSSLSLRKAIQRIQALGST